MTENSDQRCVVCGRAADVHVTSVEIRSDTKAVEHFCQEHMPDTVESMSISQHLSPAEEIALLRKGLADLEEMPFDAIERDRIRIETEQLIADIENGKRRLDDWGVPPSGN